MRLLMGSQRYYSIVPGALYERDLRELVLTHKNDLFPDFLTAPFNTEIPSAKGIYATPDLVLVARDYSAYWLVKIAVYGSDIETTLDALEIIRQAQPDADTFSHTLHTVEPAIAAHRLDGLLHERGHNVLLLTNRLAPEWATVVLPPHIRTGIVEIFESDTGGRIVRINGYQPRALPRASLRCKIVGANTLEVNPNTFLPGNGLRLRIHFEGGQAQWRRLNYKGSAYISPEVGTRFSLPSASEVDLQIRHNGDLEISIV